MSHHYLHEGFAIAALILGLAEGLLIGAMLWYPDENIRLGLCDGACLRPLWDNSYHREVMRRWRVLRKMRLRRDSRNTTSSVVPTAVDIPEDYHSLFGICIDGQPITTIYDQNSPYSVRSLG